MLEATYTSCRHLVLVCFIAFGSASVGAAPRLAFVTSTWGNADLSSWPDAAGAAGLDAADGICRARAQSAGLPEPNEFVAWLSDRDHDAYCRILGLTGKRVDECGDMAPVPEAGPWILTNGSPFAESLSALVDDRVLSPLMFNEFGLRISSAYESFTATKRDGTLNTYFDELPDCERWTSASSDPFGAFAPVGANTDTTDGWTDSQTAVSCNATRRLVCLQRGISEPLPPRSAKGKTQAFVTEADVGGNLMGLAGADAVCIAAATNGDLDEPASFKALLASSDGPVSIASRFQNTGPWYRLDGLVFAHSMDEILAGQITRPLNVTESGSYVGYAIALTGSDETGAPSGFDCSAWTSTVGIGFGSKVNATFFAPAGQHNWLSHANVSCNPVLQPNDTRKKLYCLSDTDRIFFDDYED